MMNILKLIPAWGELIQNRSPSVFEGELSKLDGLQITIHNATWCPDCQRETIDLLAFLLRNKIQGLQISVISYEDKQDYKNKKINNELTIRCLPTIIFLKNNIEVHRINEKSKDGGIASEIEEVINKLELNPISSN